MDFVNSEYKILRSSGSSVRIFNLKNTNVVPLSGKIYNVQVIYVVVWLFINVVQDENSFTVTYV